MLGLGLVSPSRARAQSMVAADSVSGALPGGGLDAGARTRGLDAASSVA
jgi:hypothetical protein